MVVERRLAKVFVHYGRFRLVPGAQWRDAAVVATHPLVD
jgi:hypothetical protein